MTPTPRATQAQTLVAASSAAAPSVVSPAVAELRTQIRRVLDHPQIGRAFAAVKIVSLNSGQTLFEENADKLLNPASNMKMFTVAAALARLSPDARISTSVYAPARPDAAGAIRGELRIYGRGDPSYAKRFTGTDARSAIDDLAARIYAAGVRRVEGDLVADESYFAGSPLGRGWEWDDLQWYYGAEVSALTVNDNAIDLAVRPGATPGAPCIVSVETIGSPVVAVFNAGMTGTTPYAAGMPGAQTVSAAPMTAANDTAATIVNRATTAASGARRTLRINRPLGSNVIEISGELPQGNAGFSGSVSITRPALLFGLMLRRSLAQRGVTITGATRVVSREDADFKPAVFTSSVVPVSTPDAPASLTSIAPASSAPLIEIASRQSPPLSVIARETLKPSQNLYTEILLRHLAAPPANATPAAGITADDGVEALRRFVGAVGIDPDAVVPADGSGLSRGDFVTADSLVRLLLFMDKHPYREAFRAALPIAGVDGTLGNRLKNTRAAGNMIAKTGTLSHATSLSGYVTARNGEQLAFALMINNHLPDTNPRAAFADPIAVLLADFGGVP